MEKAQHELDLVHQGMNLELNQKWEAEDEILMLKEEIDQVKLEEGVKCDNNTSLHSI